MDQKMIHIKPVIVMKCSNKKHISSGPGMYKHDEVPYYLFLKDRTDISKGHYKTCLDCRDRRRIAGIKFRSKLKNNHNEEKALLTQGVISHLTCTSMCHPKYSEFPRGKTPIELFRSDPKNVNSHLYETCLDCRIGIRELQIENENEKRVDIEALDKIYCTKCIKEKTIHEMYTKLDGTMAKTCIKCTNVSKSVYNKRKNLQNEIKIEFIEKFGSCCQKCNDIFLKPEHESSYIIRTLKTYLIDNIRMVDYNNKSYTTNDFISKHKNEIELRIIQFDHLTEQEQRERGILRPDDIYIKKVNEIIQLSLRNMRSETNKCQHLCCKCHLIITMEREKGNVRYGKILEKINCVNNIKTNLGGCSECGFYDEKLLRFLHFDHLDPSSKKIGVSQMTTDSDYTVDDIIRECSDDITRLLCNYCHIIHTSIQRQKGLL